jgi:4'-phosphopantetheinyl transferase EntD
VNHAALLSLARVMFGKDAGLCADGIEQLQGPLFPEELAQIDRALAPRRRGYTAGRTASRRAMAQIGFPPGPLLKGEGGAILWPAGVTGSLSHCDGHCIAVVVPTGAARSVGIDLERLQVLDADMTSTICRPDEGTGIAGDAFRPLMIFNAKEAAYKAQFALSREVFDFHRLRIDFVDGGFEAKFTAKTGPFDAGDVLAGRQAVVGGHVLSAVTIRAGSGPENAATPLLNGTNHG